MKLQQKSLNNIHINFSAKAVKEIFLLIFVIQLSLTNFALSEEIKNITINPLNRVIIEFDTIPEKLISALSDSKTLITIKSNKLKFKDNLRQLTGLGIISDVFLKADSNKTLINIKTQEKRGFTMTYYPFTNKVMVDVFLWDKLSVAEELYRTGLLAYEENIASESVKNFQKSTKLGYYEATFQLGMSLYKVGHFSEALKAFKYAFYLDSTNYDALAGISISLLQLGDNEGSYEYSKLFSASCNCKYSMNTSFSSMDIDSIYLDLSHLVLPLIDSTLAIDSTKITSAQNESLIGVSDAKNKPESIFQTIEKYIIYGFIIVGLTLVIFVFYYWKWRQTQLNKQKEQPSQTFNQNLQEAKAKISPNAVSNLYKASDLQASTAQKEPKQSNEKSEGEIISQVKMDKLGSVIESITGKSADSYKLTSSIPNINAKLQLAMHLADEQRKIKSHNLETLKTATIPSDKKKLSEVSKKLGIEKGGLETKAAMEKILKDKDKLKKLNDKFGA